MIEAEWRPKRGGLTIRVRPDAPGTDLAALAVVVATLHLEGSAGAESSVDAAVELHVARVFGVGR